ncbi:hypothetical protein [Actinomadura rudentiformis]|uniref:DUF3995 domain-containing protein n=1 Tax=Actinomadura rudentiformis TaxID=359158 RepID=A0A6H9YME1_9ACTN|nr:hypothetical protein [Actinomadura rudentiformis]KAB2344449.1 hypothetical protein F8566_31470 [Actinomadura rudentiformis]
MLHTVPRNVTALAGRLHGRPVDGVPRWIVLAAYATTLAAVPSAIWRIALGLGAPLGPPITGEGDPDGDLPSWVPGWAYLVVLSVVTEALAFLTVGLVRSWGEVFPRWIPFIGGRRVPTPAAVIPAALGAAVLMVSTLSWLPSFNDFIGPDGAVVHLSGWKLVVFVLSYGPLFAWGPLLAIVTVAYWLRRSR